MSIQGRATGAAAGTRGSSRDQGGVKTQCRGKPLGQVPRKAVESEHDTKRRLPGQRASPLCAPEIQGGPEEVGNPPKVLPAPHAGSLFTATNSLFSSTLEGVSWQLEPAVSPKGLSPAPLSPRLAQAGTRAHLGLLHLRTRRRITRTVSVRTAPSSHSWYHRFQSCTRAVVPLDFLGEKSYLLPGLIKNAPIT